MATTRTTKPAKAVEADIQILQMREGSVTCRVVGVTPLIMNRMSEKAKHELLLPKSGPKNEAAKAANLKHDIYTEYRASAYLDPDPKAPTPDCFANQPSPFMPIAFFGSIARIAR